MTRDRVTGSEQGRVLKDITSCLLQYGGARIAQLDPAWDDSILNGDLRPKDKALEKLDGRTSRCHGNSSGFWLVFWPSYHLYTRYALSDDGIWRRHSWLEADMRIIESTISRDAYFGVELSGQDLFRFVMCDVLDCIPNEVLAKMKEVVTECR